MILSSSITLAAITGVLYLVGGAEFDGYSYALGLGYLAGLQPAEYVFDGAELILVYSLVFGTLIPLFGNTVLSVTRKPIANTKIICWFRRQERWSFFVLAFGVGVARIIFVIRTVDTAPTLLTINSCPIRGGGANGGAWLVTCIVIVIAIVRSIFRVFYSRLLRFAFLVWGIVIIFFCLFIFGRAAGAGKLYSPNFKVAKINSPTLQLPPDSQVLILGSDDKNLVLLLPAEYHELHPQPRYVLRSDIKSFQLVRSSSINDFFCKPQVRLSNPAR